MSYNLKFTEKLTIAIPVFERIDFFEEAISSALNQSIKCPVIVVDNASSHNFFRDYCNERSITYYRNNSNIGMFGNWNRCIELSQTEYVIILCDDDIINPEYAIRFLKALDLFPELDLFYSDFSILNNITHENVNHRHVLPFGYQSNGLLIIENAIQFGLGFPVITSAIKKSIFTGFYVGQHGSNDWVWLYSSVSKFTCFGENSKLLQFRYHNAQDHIQLGSRLNCLLSIAFLYGVVLKKNSIQGRMLRLAKSRERNSLLYFLSLAPRNYLLELRHTTTTYADYFNTKIEFNKLWYLFSKQPLSLRNLIYRILRKVRLINGL